MSQLHRLSQEELLILDCQTTGMRPSVGQLLEISWVWVTAETDPEHAPVRSRLITLPEGAKIPWRVKEITGIQDEDLNRSVPPAQVRSEFLTDLQSRSFRSTALIHYAQFEEPFLREFLESDELPFATLCSHRLAQRLYPQVPSRNIRALSGFFGSHLGEIKRAEEHVRATLEIWRGLVTELSAKGLEDLAQVLEWLQTTPKPKANSKGIRYEYRVEKERRLSLPESPGVYRMKSRTGQVLYVGKATSLKNRVNSYFRGKRGRDSRKLELMARVWDIETTTCGSALEAALLESDEIKRWNPPYNVSLKTGRRELVYYARDFNSMSSEQSSTHPVGPFRSGNTVERIKLFTATLGGEISPIVFYEQVSKELLVEGLEKFIAREGVDVRSFQDVRQHLRFGFRLLRREERRLQHESEEVPTEQPEQEEYTPDEVADKYARMYMGAAFECRRARQLTRLLNAQIRWQEKDEWFGLRIERGQAQTKLIENSDELTVHGGSPMWPWQGLGIADYDRMSVLLSELSRHPHEVELS